MCTTEGQEPLLANRTKLEQAQKALCTILDLDKSALDCQASGDPRLLSMTMITYSHTHLYSASGRRGHPKARFPHNKSRLYTPGNKDTNYKGFAFLTLEIAIISNSCIMVSSAYF